MQENNGNAVRIAALLNMKLVRRVRRDTETVVRLDFRVEDIHGG